MEFDYAIMSILNTWRRGEFHEAIKKTPEEFGLTSNAPTVTREPKEFIVKNPPTVTPEPEKII